LQNVILSNAEVATLQAEVDGKNMSGTRINACRTAMEAGQASTCLANGSSL
jgi:hypothetical protein